MCGIVGVAGQIGVLQEKAFKTLLELDTVRGPDSTGVIFVNQRMESGFEKCVGTPWDFYSGSTIFTKPGVYSGTAKVLIGHNRWATTGEVNVDNSHPFDFDRIVGMHNGTLVKGELDSLDDHEDFEVDSQCLFHNINKHGVAKTIPNTCGTYSLVWWDKKTQKVHFIRNRERPMNYMFTVDMKTLFWASEVWMLSAMCVKHNIEKTKVFATEPNVLYTLDVERKAKGKASLWFKYNSKEILGKAKPASIVHSYEASGSFGQYPNNGTNYDQGLDGKVWCHKKKAYVVRKDAYTITGDKFKMPGDKPKGEKVDNTPIAVYYKSPSHGDFAGQIVDHRGYIDVYECRTHKVVRMITRAGAHSHHIVTNSESWDYFTLVPNSVVHVINSVNGKSVSEVVLVCQGNSLKGPFDYPTKMDEPLIPPPKSVDKEEDDEPDDSGLQNLLTHEPPNPIEFERVYPGYNNIEYNEDEMWIKLKAGCAWCGDNSHTLDSMIGEVVWVGASDYVCGHCEGNQFVQNGVFN